MLSSIMKAIKTHLTRIRKRMRIRIRIRIRLRIRLRISIRMRISIRIRIRIGMRTLMIPAPSITDVRSSKPLNRPRAPPANRFIWQL